MRPPVWVFSDFQTKRAGLVALAKNHYRYYQHYGNMLLALLAAAFDSSAVARAAGLPIWLLLAGLIATCGLAFVASRDALRKYCERTGALLGE